MLAFRIRRSLLASCRVGSLVAGLRKGGGGIVDNSFIAFSNQFRRHIASYRSENFETDEAAFEKEESEVAITLKYKLRKISKPDKLLIFLKEMRDIPSEDLSPSLLALAMSRCVILRLFDDCLMCFRKMQELEYEIPLRSYKNAMIAMNARGMSQDALVLFKEVKNLAKKPSSRVLQEFVAASKSSLSVEDLTKVLTESAQHGRTRKLNDYTSLVRRAITSGELTKIPSILGKMHKEGFHHNDTVQLNTILRAYAIGGKWKEALQLLDDSFKSPIAVPDTSRTKPFSRHVLQVTGNGVVSRMLPCRPNAQSYALVMKACVTAGLATKAMHVYQDLESSLRPDESMPQSASLFRSLSLAHYTLGRKDSAVNVIKRSITAKHFSSQLLSDGLRYAIEMGDLPSCVHILESYARVAFNYKTEKTIQIEARNDFQRAYAAGNGAVSTKSKAEKKRIKPRHKDLAKLSENADDGQGGLNKKELTRRNAIRQNKKMLSRRDSILQGLSLTRYRASIKLENKKRHRIQYLVRRSHVSQLLNACLEMSRSNINDVAVQNLAKNTALRSLRIVHNLRLELNDSDVSFLLRNDLYLLGPKGIRRNSTIDVKKAAISEYNLMVHDNRVLKVWKYAVAGLRHTSQNPTSISVNMEDEREKKETRMERNKSLIRLLHPIVCGHLNDANKMIMVFKNAFHHEEINDALFESLMYIIMSPGNQFLTRVIESGRIRMLLSPRLRIAHRASLKKKSTDPVEDKKSNPVQDMLIDLLTTKKSKKMNFPPKIGLIRLSSQLAQNGMAEPANVLLTVTKQSIIGRMSRLHMNEVRGLELLDPLVMQLSLKHFVALVHSQYWEQTSSRVIYFLSVIRRLMDFYEYNSAKVMDTFKAFSDIFPAANESLEFSMDDFTAIIKCLVNVHGDFNQALSIYNHLKTFVGFRKSIAMEESSPSWIKSFGRFKLTESLSELLVNAYIKRNHDDDDMMGAMEVCANYSNQVNNTNKEVYKASSFVPLIRYISSPAAPTNSMYLIDFALAGLKVAFIGDCSAVQVNGVHMHPIRNPSSNLLSRRVQLVRPTIQLSLEIATGAKVQSPSMDHLVAGLKDLLSLFK